MHAALRLAGAIDAFNRWMGIIAIWMVLLAALLSAFNAFFRYGINEMISLASAYGDANLLSRLIGWYGANANAFLEGQWYMFAVMALFGGAYTLKLNEHVRVDLIYGTVTERTRTWIDLIGGIVCLMPFCLYLTYLTWPWFVDAWNTGEVSTNAGGLIRWPVRLVMPVGFFLVAIQGISEIIKCVAVLTTGYVREHGYEKPLQ